MSDFDLILRRIKLVGGIAIAAIVTLVFVIKLIVDEEPYRMTLTNVDGQTVVQFAREDRQLISPQFPVDIAIDSPQSVSLRSPHISSPGCVVEFCDVTFLPGMFKARIGEMGYAVMERGIDVGGNSFEWEHR